MEMLTISDASFGNEAGHRSLKGRMTLLTAMVDDYWEDLTLHFASRKYALISEVLGNGEDSCSHR